MLPGLGPNRGDRYRNVGTGNLGVVVRLERARRTWVWLRYGGQDRRITLEELDEFWRPYRDGGL